MRRLALVLVAAASCDVSQSNPTPPEPECLDPVTRAGDPCTLDIEAEVVQFETGAAPSVPVALRYDTAWDVPQVFPVTCTPLATTSATAATAFTASFDGVSCKSPAGHVAAIVGDDVSGDVLAPSVNDRRLANGCWSGGGTCSLAPFRVWVVEKATLTAWKSQIRGVDWSEHGLVAVTYSDGQGNPVAGVTPRMRDLFDSEPSDAIPGGEVFFLADDRRSVVAGQRVTGASGVALFLVTAGLSEHVSGAKGSDRWPENGVAAPADSVFFEQIQVE
jgi:hypothetical protein